LPFLHELNDKIKKLLEKSEVDRGQYQINDMDDHASRKGTSGGQQFMNNHCADKYREVQLQGGSITGDSTQWRYEC
jgi:hypothetical protein